MSSAMLACLESEQTDGVAFSCVNHLLQSVSHAIYENYLKEKEKEYAAARVLDDVLQVIEVFFFPPPPLQGCYLCYLFVQLQLMRRDPGDAADRTLNPSWECEAGPHPLLFQSFFSDFNSLICFFLLVAEPLPIPIDTWARGALPVEAHFPLL